MVRLVSTASRVRASTYAAGAAGPDTRKGTYLDAGEELLVGLLLDPRVLGGLGGEVLCELLHVGLVEEGFVHRIERSRAVLLGGPQGSVVGVRRGVLVHTCVHA